MAARANRDDNSVLPKAKPPASRRNSRREREINALPDKQVFMKALVLHRIFFRIDELLNLGPLLIQFGQVVSPQPLVNL